jgi:hypothetical protein
MKKLLAVCLLWASTANAFVLTPADYVSLIFHGVRFVSTESVPEEITVTEKGIGHTQSEAIQNALNLAVQKAVGVLIVSDQTVKGEKVVRNLVAQYSSGVVNSYEVKSCTGKPLTCEIVAKVSPWKFMRKLQGDSSTIQVNGKDLLAQHQTAKIALLQREYITQYYMQQIRQSGLDVVVHSVKVEPSDNSTVKLIVDYEVKWNKEFKKEIIKFLEKLEKDTIQEQSNHQVYIQWGPTGWSDNRVYINTYNERYKRMMLYFIHQPTYVEYINLGICENIQSENIFTLDWYGGKRKTTLEIEPAKLKNLNEISMSIGCS